MSAETFPISPSAFAAAIVDLPLSSLHLKNLELRNSIAHLDYSNEELRPFTTGPEADPICIEAIQENEIVIKRMEERIDLLKAEVEGRGVSWREFIDVGRERGQEEDRALGATDVEVGTGSLPNGTATAADGQAAQSQSRAASSSSPWTDGTFTTGRIVNGEVILDAPGTGLGAEAAARSFPADPVEPTASRNSGATSTGAAVNSGFESPAASAAAAAPSVPSTAVNGVSSSRDGQSVQTNGQAAQGGSLTDEELRRRLAALGGVGDDDDDGLHL